MQFFELTDDERHQLPYWDPNKVDLESITCPIDPGHQRGGGRRTRLTIIVPSLRLGDFVWTVHHECMVTDRVAKLLRAASFTGYELDPVRVSKVKGTGGTANRLPKLWELRVLGWGGMAGSESGIELLSECAGCGHLVYSTYRDASKLIVPDRWDGSDFFMVWPLPRYVFITERVRNLIAEEGLTGCRVVAVEDINSPLQKGIATHSPGRLSHSMPAERARELGRTLGIY